MFTLDPEVGSLIESIHKASPREEWERLVHFVEESTPEALSAPGQELATAVARALGALLRKMPGLTDRETRTRWTEVLNELAQAGNSRAWRHYGLLLRDQDQFDEAIHYLSMAGHANVPKAWFDCGFAVLIAAKKEKSNGNNAAALPGNAVRYFEKGAEHGSGQSMYFLYQHYSAIALTSTTPTVASETRNIAIGWLANAAGCTVDTSPQAQLAYSDLLIERGDWLSAFEYASRVASLDISHNQTQLWIPGLLQALKCLEKAPADPDQIASHGRDSVAYSLIEKASRGQSVSGTNDKAIRESLGKIKAGKFETINQQHWARVKEDIPEFSDGIEIRNLFAPDRKTAQAARIAAFSAVSRMLDDPARCRDAENLLNLISNKANDLINIGYAYAKDVLNDAGLVFLKGEVYFKQGQLANARECFIDSAGLKFDAQHVSYCQERLAATFEAEGNFLEAIKHCREGYLISGHPHMLMRYAKLLIHNAPHVGVNALSIVESFLTNVSLANPRKPNAALTWTYDGAKQEQLKKLGYDLEIQLPDHDADPEKTIVQYASMIRWLKSAPRVAASLLKKSEQNAIKLLIDRLPLWREASALNPDVLTELSALAEYPMARNYLCRLIEHCATENKAVRKELGRAVLHPRRGVEVLESLARGFSVAQQMPDGILEAIMARIVAKPELIKLEPHLASALASLAWRGVILAYYSKNKNRDDFKQWVQKTVARPLWSISDAELRRLWFFELVAVDKTTVQYAQVFDYCARVQDTLRELLGPASQAISWLGSPEKVAEADNWLRDLLVQKKESVTPLAYGKYDGDRISYAFGRLKKDIQEWAKESLGAIDEVEIDVPQAHRDEYVLSTNASSLFSLVVDVFRVNQISSPWQQLLAATKNRSLKIAANVVDGVATAKVRVRGRMQSLSKKQALSAQSALKARLNSLSKVDVSTKVSMTFDPAPENKWTASLEFPLDRSPSSLGKDWSAYFGYLRSEHEIYRDKGKPLDGFYANAYDKMPEIENPAMAPELLASEAAVVLHAACDRFHGMFLYRTAVAKNADTDPAGIVHDIRKHFLSLKESRQNGNDMIPQLTLLRERLGGLSSHAISLIQQEISAWRPSSIDLGEHLYRALHRIEPNHSALDALGKTRSKCMVWTVRRALSLVVDELLFNALQSGNLVEVLPSCTNDENWNIVIRCNKATSTSLFSASKLGGTGRGRKFAKELAFWNGMTVDEVNSKAELRITLASSIGP